MAYKKLRSYYLKKYSAVSLVENLITSDNPPLPIMSARKGFVYKTRNGYMFQLLNHLEEMDDKINWDINIADKNFRLWLMNLHYMEYLEEVDDNDFIKLVEDWIDSNKIFRNKFDWAAWNSYSLSIRTLIWMQQISRRRIDLNLPQLKKIKQSLVQQLLFLERNIEKDIGGNHIIKNIKTLLWASSFFSGETSLRLKKIALQLLKKELEEQILPDGMHFELSTAYHCQVFVDLLECYTVLTESPFKTELLNKLKLMAQVINDITHPDNEISVFNDGSIKMSYSAAECLNTWAKISGSLTRTNQQIKLDSSGYYGFRNENIYILVDAGKVGADHLPAHSHGDIFSFELSVGKERIIVDPGVFEYNPGDKRNYSRATSSHNTLTLNDLDQCEFYGSFRVAQRAKVKILNYTSSAAGFELTAVHDGYKRLNGRPLHTRKFMLNENILEVTDEITGGNRQLAVASLLLHPEFEIIGGVNEIKIRKNEINIIINTSDEYKIQPAYYFPEFGKSVQTKSLKIFYGKCPCQSSFQIHIPNLSIKPVKHNVSKLNLV